MELRGGEGGWGGGTALVKVYQETEKDEGGGVTTKTRRTCADTVKLSHFLGSASLILLMFGAGQRDLRMQLFSPIKGNICQDHKSSYWTVIY